MRDFGDERVTVAVRVKPAAANSARTLNCLSRSQLAFTKNPGTDAKAFAFDHVFEDEIQSRIYDTLGDRILSQVC